MSGPKPPDHPPPGHSGTSDPRPRKAPPPLAPWLDRPAAPYEGPSGERMSTNVSWDPVGQELVSDELLIPDFDVPDEVM